MLTDKDTNEIFYTAIKYQFNASQLNAIKNICLSSDKISLLQGPVNLIFRKKLKFDNSLEQERLIHLLE